MRAVQSHTRITDRHTAKQQPHTPPQAPPTAWPRGPLGTGDLFAWGLSNTLAAADGHTALSGAATQSSDEAHKLS